MAAEDMTREELEKKIFNSVKPVPFEVYSEMFREWFIMKRENGILEVRMHTDGGPAVWSYGLHKGLGLLAKYVALDLENQVFILTGTGDYWIRFPNTGDSRYGDILREHAAKSPQQYARDTYDDWYKDGEKLLKAYLFDIEIPTIAAINGPSPVGHTEMALACDLTLCTPDSYFREGHFASIDMVPGDGQYLSMRHFLGDKRMNYLTYTGEPVTAQRALEWGLVNEVVEKDKLLDRAWELARSIRAKSYHTRRLTHLVMTQQWKRDLVLDFDPMFAYEGWAATMISPEAGLNECEKIADETNK